MANATIRIRDNLATTKITKLQRNVPGVTRRTLYEAAKSAQEVIIDTLFDASTEWGKFEVERGYTYVRGRRVPRKWTGRYSSGDLVNSFRRQALATSPMQTVNSNGQIVQKIGTTRPVAYMEYQDSINNMRALHHGRVAFRYGVLSNLRDALREAGRDAEANRTSRRIEYWNLK